MYFNHTPVTIRLANAHDDWTLRALAELDSKDEALRGRILVAELDGVPRAALSLADGEVVADPFVPTADAVEMLRLRAHAIRGREPRRGLMSRLRGAFHHPSPARGRATA